MRSSLAPRKLFFVSQLTAQDTITECSMSQSTIVRCEHHDFGSEMRAGVRARSSSDNDLEAAAL